MCMLLFVRLLLSSFRITDKLLPFDLSILILEFIMYECMNLLCIYRYFL